MENFPEYRKEHWSYEIIQKYESLFESPGRYIEVDEGWKSHIIDMLESLRYQETHNTRNNINNVIKIFQIKEKFGRIRIYVDCSDDISHIVNHIVSLCDGKCYLTCEKCGALENDILKNNNGWLMSLCHKCFSELNSQKGDSSSNNSKE